MAEVRGAALRMRRARATSAPSGEARGQQTQIIKLKASLLALPSLGSVFRIFFAAESRPSAPRSGARRGHNFLLAF